MNKKIAVLTLALFMLLTSYIPLAFALDETKVIPNIDELVIESIGDMETADPAWAYDTASASVIMNVYDTLLFFDHESIEQYEPLLAESWLIDQPPHPDAPPGTHSTWYFKLRNADPATGDLYDDNGNPIRFQPWQDALGVWHRGEIVNAEDVEYSFERAMVQDRSGGPIWMFYEPLHGRFHADMDWPEAEDNPIDTSVEGNTTHVWFNLVMPYAPFIQILSQSWASIVNKDFCIAVGDWPGTWDNWKDYHDPQHSPLDVGAPARFGGWYDGTGPYMMDVWEHGVKYSLVAYELGNPERIDPYVNDDEYWRGWPAAGAADYVRRVTEWVVYEWGTRLADFKTGTADAVYVPRAFIPQVEGVAGIRGVKDLPTLICTAVFFNFKITDVTKYGGSGQLDGAGIPPDFFNNTNVRMAFAHALNWTEYIEDVFLNEAEQPPTPHIRGLAYSDWVWDGHTLTEDVTFPNGTTVPAGTYMPPIDRYAIDITKVEEYLKAAVFDDPLNPGQTVSAWDRGFYFHILYNIGNYPREVAATMLETNIESLNAKRPGLPPFEIVVEAVSWPTFLGEIWYYPTYRSRLPIYVIGWLADYADPHNFMVPFAHKYGDFAYPSSYNNEDLNLLLDTAIATPEGETRGALYHQASRIYHVDAPSLPLVQALGRHWERDWYQGWYYNSITPGTYFYHIWKGLNADANGRAGTYGRRVDSEDVAVVSAHWYPGPPTRTYDRVADIAPVSELDGADYILPGADGEVDTLDATQISIEWHDVYAAPP